MRRLWGCVVMIEMGQIVRHDHLALQIERNDLSLTLSLRQLNIALMLAFCAPYALRIAISSMRSFERSNARCHMTLAEPYSDALEMIEQSQNHILRSSSFIEVRDRRPAF